MAIPSPSELTFVATQAALSAGDLLRRGFGTEFTIDSKEGIQNYVTEYDRAAEKSIISTIFKHFPHHAILAEESGETNKGKSSVMWIIDPLDGTVNFARHIPNFCTSIAAAIDGNVVSGVIYQPMTNELFVAEKGKGAYLNGKQIFVSKVDSLDKALLATGFPYDVHKNPMQCIDLFAKMQKTGIPIRRLGSAALDLAYVAAGRFDAFWEVGLNSWDMAAGKLLIEEAGGKISHWDGSPHKIFGYETALASNGQLHPAMVSHLK